MSGKPMSIAEALPIRDKTLEYIQRGWTKGHYAVDAKGRRVDPWDDRACAWCLAGAVEAALTELELPGSDEFRFFDVWSAQNLCSPIAYNDKIERTKEEVLASLEAIR